jgi:uncharacterized OB-fold protein
MEIPRHWRLRRQRLALVGEICPICLSRIFPPREVCPVCQGDHHQVSAQNEQEVYVLAEVDEFRSIAGN